MPKCLRSTQDFAPKQKKKKGEAKNKKRDWSTHEFETTDFRPPLVDEAAIRARQLREGIDADTGGEGADYD